MNQGLQQPPGDAGDGVPADGPYALLGLESGASFEAVQAAKVARLAEVGEDSLARSRIEAAYDAVLMERLKERQQGKVSTAAVSASQREDAAATAPRPVLPRLPQLRLPSAPVPRLGTSAPRLPAMPHLDPASGRELWIPIGVGALLVALLLLGPLPAELLLALAAIGAVVALQRRHRRLLPAVGWSIGALSVGLLLGVLLLRLLDPALPLGLPLAPEQVQSLPALLLLLLAAVLIG